MKLTAKEKAWFTRVQKALDACPSHRIGFYTIGDAQVTLYDRTKEDVINEHMDSGRVDFCGAVDKAKAEIEGSYFLEFPAAVHSTSG